MEITLETIYRQQLELKAQFKTEVGRLDDKVDTLGDTLGNRVGRLEHTVGLLERKVDESRIKTVQWVVGIFVGAIVIISTLGSVYISATMLLAR